MNILLVDDNRLMQEGMQNLLEAHGMQVAGMAADGQQAHPYQQQLITRRNQPTFLRRGASTAGKLKC